MKDVKIFLNKKKKKKKQYGRKRYKHFSEDVKQKLLESRKKYDRMRKKCLIIIIRNYYF